MLVSTRSELCLLTCGLSDDPVVGKPSHKRHREKVSHLCASFRGWANYNSW